MKRGGRLKPRAVKPRGSAGKDPDYLDWIRGCPCLVCGARPAQAHHAGPRGFGAKTPDRQAVPLCWRHHDRQSAESVHALGPAEFERRFAVALLPAARVLRAVYDGEEELRRHAEHTT